MKEDIDLLSESESENLNSYEPVSELGGLTRSELTEWRKYYRNNIFKFFLVCKLTAGQMFGELGIMYDKPRAASIACAENSIFVTLNLDSYKNIIASIDQRIQFDKAIFFQKCIFPHMSVSQVISLAY